MYTVWYRKTVPTLSSCHMESDHNKNLQRVRKGFLLRFKIAVYTSSPHPSNSWMSFTFSLFALWSWFCSDLISFSFSSRSFFRYTACRLVAAECCLSLGLAFVFSNAKSLHLSNIWWLITITLVLYLYDKKSTFKYIKKYILFG